MAKKYLGLCVSWGWGYAGTWTAKWIFGSVVLNRNVITDAMGAVVVRTVGDQEYEYSILRTFKSTLETWLTPEMRVFLVIMICIIVLIIICERKLPQNTGGILCTAILPYLWYSVLSNHSDWHFWFTYRSQVITLFAILIIGFDVIDNINKKMQTILRRKL